MKTIHQLTQDMLAHNLADRVGDAFNDIINYIILPELDKNIETYNFKNKSVDPLKAAALIAQIFKISEPLQQCFTSAMVILRDNEDAILYLLNFNLCDFNPDLIFSEISRAIPGNENRYISYNLHNNQLTLTIYDAI